MVEPIQLLGLMLTSLSKKPLDPDSYIDKVKMWETMWEWPLILFTIAAIVILISFIVIDLINAIKDKYRR